MDHIVMFLLLATIHVVLILLGLTVHILRGVIKFHGICIDSVAGQLCPPCLMIDLFVVIEDNTRLFALSLLCQLFLLNQYHFLLIFGITLKSLNVCKIVPVHNLVVVVWFLDND